MRSLAIVCLLLVAAAPAVCPERPGDFASRPGRAQTDRTVVGFLSADGAYIGSGTVIDRHKRLILTAIHVVEPELSEPRAPTFTFLADPARRPHHGRVIWKTELPQLSDEDSGKNWDKPRDIAIVQDDEAIPEDVLVADVAPEIAIDEHLSFTGFPEGGSPTTVTDGAVGSPQPNEADVGYAPTTPAPTGPSFTPEQTQCTRSVMRETHVGMSGSAVVTAYGRVAGVTIASAGPGQAGRYVRLSCFFDPVTAQAIAPAWLVEAIRTMPTGALTALLQHSPNDPTRPITNLELFAAAQAIQAAIERRDAMPDLALTNVRCALIPVAYARNLPTDGWGFRWNREAADGLQQGIEKLKPDDKRQRARQLVGLFLRALNERFLTQPVTAATAKSDFTEEDLRTLSGLSDAAYLAADDEKSSPYAQLSKKAAAVIILSGGGSASLVGKAYATIGAISALQRDYPASVRAYNEAAIAGYTPSWLWRAKADASRMLGGSNVAGALYMNAVRDAAGVQLGPIGS